MITKKIFLSGLCTVLLTSTVSSKNIDSADLSALVKETAEAFIRISDAFESTRAAYGNKVKKYMKAVFSNKKSAIKAIKKRLKKDYKAAKRAADESFLEKRSLYRAFKERVYRIWVATKELPPATL